MHLPTVPLSNKNVYTNFNLKVNSILISDKLPQLCCFTKAMVGALSQSLKTDYYGFPTLVWFLYVPIFSYLNYKSRKLTRHIILFFLSLPAIFFK